MDISISYTLNGTEHVIRPTIVNSWLIVIVLSILFIVIGRRFKKMAYDEKPKGIYRLAEIFIEAIDNLTKETMGKANMGFAPYIATLAIYLAIANLLGLIGLTPPTSDYNVTLTLAMITFFLIHFSSIRLNGLGGYLKGYLEPISFLLPINIMGEIAVPISLSFRLFGNVLTGVLLMGLIYGALSGIGMFIGPLVTPVLHAYFDVFSGLLQTFIFMMLSMVQISNAIGDRDVVETKF